MPEYLKTGMTIYHKTNKTSAVISDLDNKNITIELSRPITNKLILKLPITHMGEWLFYEKNDIDLPLSDLANMPQYIIYGNKTLAASRAPLKKKRVRVQIKEQRKPDPVIELDNILRDFEKQSEHGRTKSRFVSPPIDQLDKLRQPLTSGENLVFQFFNKHLPKRWEIYVQPHLNGLRPDFVLLNPDVGIAVFEVKDWDLDAMEYWIGKKADGRPILMAKKDGREFSLQAENPVEKVRIYQQEISDLYCPRLERNATLSVITAGIIFPFAEDQKINDLLSKCLDYRGMSSHPKYNPLSGKHSLRSGDIEKVFPESKRRYSYYMNESLAKDLRNWLVEPDFASTQRQPLELNEQQRYFVTTRTTSGYRRIKGPAGSGKSLVLAARAAKLIDEGKKVLVVGYNITLLHYLMDLAVRWPRTSGNTRQDITWLNFHAWCKRVCQESGHEEEYNGLWNDKTNSNGIDSVLNESLPNLVSAIIDKDEENIVSRYDAVLVDEGQDFRPLWWNTLRKVCHKDGEMLLVADATQDVYGCARSWTDEAMIGAGFPGGKWAELQISHRLPPKALEYARSFATRFLPPETTDLPQCEQMELDLYPCKLRWVQTNTSNALSSCVKEILSMPPNVDPDLLAVSDITFLTANQGFGSDVVNELKKRNVNCVDTFSDNTREARRKKLGFYMGDSRIKVTTLHSFKGWESRALVIYVDDNTSLPLVYTGITRLKRHEKGSFLTIVSTSQRLQEYGSSWRDYED